MQTKPVEVIDYDANGYDYRSYWSGRDYEFWAEDRVLRRLVPKLGRPRWFADFGGAFGRNAGHYLPHAEHSVIMDYSATNLRNAGDRYAAEVAAGRLHLIRCDLYRIPFRDFAFDAAMVVRVLHHLSDLDRGLTEMSRTIGGQWLVDVPIKHHVLGLARGLKGGDLRRVRGPEPVAMGVEEPYWNFQLRAVRARLGAMGWRTALGASVNNFRQWEKVAPAKATKLARPLVHGMEVVAQTAGRGWWGPSQFVLGRRNDPAAPAYDRLRQHGDDLAPHVADLARRVVCPQCVSRLDWTPDTATCARCQVVFPRQGAFWDFVLPA
ncbi:class I SAM-dependent methyltransferase [Catellatospora sp. KI3]|uniref:class I SAM-dependent methyltransferase n=1 Tax=Catellatospora sp. KI3 TaxID=3041620 RepID=UPI0024821FE6|nr:class I SAM-dependent methyltransferase [Catellatospora sp. KI3]MDI1461952.1 class I SAM-dependent methyltransferase [Catellatospora sp. KI3]